MSSIEEYLELSNSSLDTLKELAEYLNNKELLVESKTEYNRLQTESLPTNCINCNAVIDLSKDRCPYCDTSYRLMRRRRGCYQVK